MNKEKVILDATLRDGGLVNNHYFDNSFVEKLYETNKLAGIDYMEFGYRADKKMFSPLEYGKWKFSSDEDILDIVKNKKNGPKISVMVDVGRCDYKNDITDKGNSPVDLFRVATYMNQLNEALDMIEFIYQKGYKVTCNIMATSECTIEQRKEAISTLKHLPLEAVYIVDSYGALYPDDIKVITQEYIEGLSATNIGVGIHAHNNQQLAFANTIESFQNGATWLDATAAGMGRGAGNCLMELLIGYLKESQYALEPILEFVSAELSSAINDGIHWGYNYFYFLTGLANVHPRSAINATKGYNKSIDEFMKEIKKYSKNDSLFFDAKTTQFR